MLGFLKKIRRLRQDKNDVAAAIIGTVFFILWIWAVSYKYFHFGYYDWDLAFFSQAMWSLTHGSQFVSLVGINFFGDHSYFITLLIAPVFALFPHPLTLVLLKIIAYLLSAFILYIMAKKSIGAAWALTFMFLYLIFPGNVFSILYEFNVEGLAPIFIFLMFYSYGEKKLAPFMINALLLILIKENMALVLSFFGILGLFSKERSRIRWGIIPLMIGGVYFLAMSFVVIPHFRGLEGHAFTVRYEQLGGSLPEIIRNIFTHPLTTLKILTPPENIKFITELFGPLLILTLLGLPFLFPALPLLFQHLLSAHAPEHSIFYHYASSIVPFIFLASLQSFALLRKRFRPLIARAVFSFVSLLCLLSALSYSHDFLTRLNYHNDNLTFLRWNLIKQIPNNAPVVATFDFLADLSRRESLYSFHKIYNQYYQDPSKIKHSELYVKKSFELPDDVRWALIDFNDPWLNSELHNDTKTTASFIENFMSSGKWSIVSAAGDLVLLKRGTQENNFLLIEKTISPIDFSPDTRATIVDKKFEFLFDDQEKSCDAQGEHCVVPLTFYWKPLTDMADHYFVVFILKKEDAIINGQAHRIGYTIYPTPTWRMGDLIKERYWLTLPRLAQGRYSLEVKLINETAKRWANLLESAPSQTAQKDTSTAFLANLTVR